MATQQWTEGGVVMFIIIVNALIGIFQGTVLVRSFFSPPLYFLFVFFFFNINVGYTNHSEFKSEKTMAALQKMSSPTSCVLRDGQKVEVLSSEIIPRDIMLLRKGDKLPATPIYLLLQSTIQVIFFLFIYLFMSERFVHK